ncbi:hypothetical protein Tco_0928537 [Tanacetum coccineum]
MEAGTNSTTLTAKLHILNPRDYDLWLMRIEQYFLMTDYSLWEVIKNDSKLLMEAIEKRYGGNKESKKVQRTLLKQQIGSSSTSQNLQNVAFVSYNSTHSNSRTNEADNTIYEVSDAHPQSNPSSGDYLSDAMIFSFLVSQPNSPQMLREDLEQIDPDDLEEMDLQ